MPFHCVPICKGEINPWINITYCYGLQDSGLQSQEEAACANNFKPTQPLQRIYSAGGYLRVGGIKCLFVWLIYTDLTFPY